MFWMRLVRRLARGRFPCTVTAAILVATTACGPVTHPVPIESPAPRSAVPPATTSGPPSTAQPTQQLLPAEPIPLRFEAEDGQELEGTFYPAAEDLSPVIVLMHWIRSDETDWSAVARWLQNRLPPLEPSSGGPSWLDPSWFPEAGSDRSYAVFTFTFRGCRGGCQRFEAEGWLRDACAALQTAAGQPGVDPMRMVAIGASIGGDGAIDACAWLSTKSTGSRCQGALSLSPGGYLGIPYAGAVQTLIGALRSAGALPPAEAALCVASEGDSDSAEACGSAQSPHYRAIIYTGHAHGMELLVPSLEPNALSLIADFLAGVTYP